MAVAKKEEKEKRKNKKQRFDEPHGFLENLPFDLVMEILPRLPIKSLLRLKLASKLLSPLISDHLRRYILPNAASGLFFTFPISKNFYSKNFYHAFNNNSKFMDVTLRIDEIVGCCNGLLLCKRFTNNQVAVPFVCNPLTGQRASIPNSVSGQRGSYPNSVSPNSVYIKDDAVLAFDPRVSGHYNILCFRSGTVDIFSSETGSWLEKKQPASHVPFGEDSFPIFFNGKVYFPSHRSPFLKIFDLRGRFRGRINLPHHQMGIARRLLGHSGGRLQFAVRVNDEMLVWFLEESRWVLKHSVSLWSIFGSSTLGCGSYHLRAFHPDIGVVFFRVKDKLLSYNMDNGDLAEVCTYPMMHWSFFVYSPCYSKDFDL